MIRHEDDRVTLHHGDCLDVLRSLPDASVDAVVTDPPYGLEFMGKAWDGADGFRRSLNAADAGRENVFGRTSTTSPEYRTASKATATRRQEGGIPQATGPSFLGGLNPKCLACNRWQRGANPCRCESPEWTQERLVRLHSFQEWCEAWATECLRVLKPGGHLLAFGGTRTWHRLACAVEDAGFEIRDGIAWLYGSGFPKSLDVSKAIDKAAGAERLPSGAPTSLACEFVRAGIRCEGHEGEIATSQSGLTIHALPTAPATPEAETWQGWGTALKPAFEPIVVARKPLVGTVAANVLAHGTGALNVDGCRIGDEARHNPSSGNASVVGMGTSWNATETDGRATAGRWPANVILDESQAAELDEQSGERPSGGKVTGRQQSRTGDSGIYGAFGAVENSPYDDTGGASRFFYTAKASADERVRADGIAHPTVKPLALMRWLVRLVTPPGGTVLEPFAGSGTTVEACILEGFSCVAIEREADYLPLIEQRIARGYAPPVEERTTVKAAIDAAVDQMEFGSLLGDEAAS